jgi:4-amino-4-deoxy-L-arabinose transferase-like glycosyltransferase
LSPGTLLLAPAPLAQRCLHGVSLVYAAIAKSTLSSGDRLSLRLGDEPHVLKPPLMSWAAMASLLDFGPTTRDDGDAGAR